MKIGIAIPCFINHINACYRLLDSIDKQTRLPDQVIVSCSSSKLSDFILKTYRFPLIVLVTAEHQNAAQNRNKAADHLETDIITFIDADDSMHPQRLEAIEQAFEDSGTTIVLHSFLLNEECEQPFPFFVKFVPEKNILNQCYSGCIKFVNNDPVSRIHHSQASVRQSAYKAVRFPEDKASEGREDCRFCYGVFSLPGTQSSYLRYPLSKYSPSKTMG
jgi:glycosyltransferase involved in cell wall biosynthesis